MVVVLKRGGTKKNMQKILEDLIAKKKSTGVDTQKYVGTIKLKKDPLIFQRELRDECVPIT